MAHANEGASKGDAVGVTKPPELSRHARRPGAHFDGEATTFTVWSSNARAVDVRWEDAASPGATRAERLEPMGDGWFERRLSEVKPGALYTFVLDGDGVPDPFARFMPRGVHGAARVEASTTEPGLASPPAAHAWVIYEIHVGSFSPEGTYRGVQARLDELVELGITAIELMPLAAFPGERGWGYDGVSLYAPYAGYGEPDDLRALVRAAHARGLAVLLDVVYNHFGPSGNYLARYGTEYFSSGVSTPWGEGPNFEHPSMRGLVLENVRYWLEEFGFDGLRLDATHAIADANILREITASAHAMSPARRIFFEDERNDPSVVTDLGADAVWADDFHHQVHVLLTAERDGYYGAYEPTVSALADVLRRGWAYEGKPYAPWNGVVRGKPRGSLRPEELVYTIQNHDQIGNRAFGDRLCHGRRDRKSNDRPRRDGSAVDSAEDSVIEGYLAASLLLLFLPSTPLLFMGQEWAASAPFPFFSDHEGEVGENVSKGRREEFKTFAAFTDPGAREAIPDPQQPSTFASSKLDWSERRAPPHVRALHLYRTALRLRRSDVVLAAPCAWAELDARSDGNLLTVIRRHGAAERRLVVNFGDDAKQLDERLDANEWRLLVATQACSTRTIGPRAAVLLARG